MDHGWPNLPHDSARAKSPWASKWAWRLQRFFILVLRMCVSLHIFGCFLFLGRLAADFLFPGSASQSFSHQWSSINSCGVALGHRLQLFSRVKRGETEMNWGDSWYFWDFSERWKQTPQTSSWNGSVLDHFLGWNWTMQRWVLMSRVSRKMCDSPGIWNSKHQGMLRDCFGQLQAITTCRQLANKPFDIWCFLFLFSGHWKFFSVPFCFGDKTPPQMANPCRLSLGPVRFWWEPKQNGREVILPRSEWAQKGTPNQHVKHVVKSTFFWAIRCLV